LSVLGGMRQAVPYLSFEVNLPEFRAEGLECVRALAGLAPTSEFNYTSDCRVGLALKRWQRAEQFLGVLLLCSDPSIEVFARTVSYGEC